MSKKTLTLIIFLVLVVVALIMVSIKQSGQKVATTAPVVSPTPAATSILMLSPTDIYLTPSDTSGSADVMLSSGSNKVTGVQLELSFDPKVLSITNITPPSSDPFFDTTLSLMNKVDNTNGTATYMFGVPPGATAKAGQGNIATIFFRVKTRTQEPTALILTNKSLVSAEGVSSSVLRRSSSSRIMFVTAVPSPTVPTR